MSVLHIGGSWCDAVIAFQAIISFLMSFIDWWDPQVMRGPVTIGNLMCHMQMLMSTGLSKLYVGFVQLLPQM